ncbi:MAG: aldehyde ferredoxin oxidoreductase, partial [Chloroflexi bacterium]|nr:aldehyde ferredoxin oxidoreductase [Chloroflexota bacterium]
MMQPILKVNLSTGAMEVFEIPEAWEKEYIGGASLGARLLFDGLVPELNPLSPEAPLLFLVGPLSGTAGPAVGRFVVCGRSPATGLWGESNCGGFWGPELRQAGYDGLWLTGKAETPALLWFHDRQVEIREAAPLWGLDTYQAQAAVTAVLDAGQARVAVIGPAGEAGLPFALILTDHGRVAGRTGLGAVMGAKNLKAIAVQGHGKIPVKDTNGYLPLRAEANRALRADAMSTALRELGSASAADYFDYLGEMPKLYYQYDAMKGAAQVSGASVRESILAGVSACHACVIACGRVVRLEDGEKRKGPEYETLVGFGPNLGLSDASFATRMGELCDRYGMDTISLSNTIGLAFKLYQDGRVTEKDTGNLRLEWGNAAAVEALVEATARRSGMGAWLAEGALSLARRFGAEEEAVQVNGLEAAYHDPRGASGMALVYATSPRGACHNQSDYFLADIGQVEASLGMEFFDRQSGADKAANVARHQDWRTVFNSLIMCYFANVPPETVRDLVNA